MPENIYQPSSASCFLCGKNNPMSLKVRWLNNYEENHVETSLIIPEEYCSFKGTAHGGVLAALLDETAGRAIMIDNNFDRLMVTMKLETVYKKPTPTGVLIRVIGRVIKDSGGRASVEGEVLLPDGSVSATCQALLFKIPDSVRDGWDQEELSVWNESRPDVALAEKRRAEWRREA